MDAERLRTISKLYGLPVLAGFAMSLISSQYLFVGSGLNLIPWGLLALSFGLIANTRKKAIKLGATYGFSQAFIFLWIDKAGSITVAKFFILLIITSILGLLAAGCAAIGAYFAYTLKTSLR